MKDARTVVLLVCALIVLVKGFVFADQSHFKG